VFDSSFNEAWSPPVNAFSGKQAPSKCLGLGVGTPEEGITAPLACSTVGPEKLYSISIPGRSTCSSSCFRGCCENLRSAALKQWQTRLKFTGLTSGYPRKLEV